MTDEFQHQIRNDIAELRRLILALTPRRLKPNKDTCGQLCLTVRLGFRDWCPCCHNVALFDEEGELRTDIAEFDHWRDHPGKSKPHDMWLICSECHGNFTRGVWVRENHAAAFEAFQLRRRLILEDPRSLPLFAS